MIALVGFMGSGKTTVGRLLAARLGRSFVDTDRVVESRAGRSIAEIFATEGETLFRSLEREIVLAALTGPEAVVALGGGAVGDPAVAAELKQVDTIYLEVTSPEVLTRVGAAQTARPLLAAEDPAMLLARRRPLYESVASHTVETTGRAVGDIVDEIVRLLGLPGNDTRRRVSVGLGPRSYDVIVGAGVIDDPDSLPPTVDAEKAFVVTHERLSEMTAPLCNTLRTRGLAVQVLLVPEGEKGKSLAVVGDLYGRLAEAGAHRHDLLVTFGGGVVSDVGGFVGSTYGRGMELIHVPTTLLGQVDAAIGGKTAINLPDAKNLVGTVYQPRAVLCDVELLRTCPVEEIRSGMAEVIKYGFIIDPDLLDVVVRHARGIERCDTGLLVPLVGRCVAIKAAIVSADEREDGERAFLNYGHTFAHAIEAASGFEGVRHGEAVAIGMMAAAFTARELGRIDDDVVELHRRVLTAAGLPVRASLDLSRLEGAWKHDKKYRRGVRFVLLMDVGKPEAGVEVTSSVLEKAVAKLDQEGAL